MFRKKHTHATGFPSRSELLHDPALNKGTAFTDAERDALGIRGLLPPRVSTQSQQVMRVMGNYRKKPTDIERYIFLVSLQTRNEALFYRLLIDHITEMMPIVYTPTVGQACLEYGHIFRKPRGLYIAAEDRGHVEDILWNWFEEDVRVIVVTDGERILGLGDQGADGMGIPVGKLALYSACGGIPPANTLPITLDVGTNNETLRNDPLYVGRPHPRITGQAYDDFIDEFIAAVREVFPRALIQFEDFANHNAFRLLHRYRDTLPCFNDDIQGTAAVTLAGLYSSLRITGGRLRDQTILFQGAGEAGIGIGSLIVSAMEREGVSRREACRRVWFLDSKGLVVSSRQDLASHKRQFAHDHPPIDNLLDAVRTLKPNALIGVSASPQSFTRDVIELMGRNHERPIIFPLSNPTSRSECTAEQAYRGTDGRAIFASGSPFAPVKINGKVLHPGQSNNVYIFPGIGLGVTACRASYISDTMFFEAARTLSELASPEDLREGNPFPPLSDIRDVSARIAAAVARVAYDEGWAQRPHPGNILKEIQDNMYVPEYTRYV